MVINNLNCFFVYMFAKMYSLKCLFLDHLEDSSGRKRKRRNMWQKGLTPKKKRNSKNFKVCNIYISRVN